MMTMLRVVALCLVVYVANVVSYDQDACCLGGLKKHDMRDDIWKLQEVQSDPYGQLQQSQSCCHIVIAHWEVNNDEWTCDQDYVLEHVCCGACRLRPGFDPNDPNHIPNPWQPNLWPARFGDMMCCIAIPDEQTAFFPITCRLNADPINVQRVYHFKHHLDCQVTA